MSKKKHFDLNKYGIKTKSDLRDTISLERYRDVPLHAMFLYTTEDEYVHQYIVKNWGALDSLSGNYCDIHPTLDQFDSKEDAYDFIDKLDVINRSGFNELSKLPGLFFWNLNAESAFITFSEIQSEQELTKLVRRVFEKVRLKPEIATIVKLNKNNQLNKPEIVKQNSLFKDILPFLIVFLVVIGTIALISKLINPILLGLVLISTIIIFILIGVFLFRHRNQLSEGTFKDIVISLIKQLPLLKKDKVKDEKEELE